MINLIKNIFSDIAILYKNFLHFTLSKIVIYLVAILYTFILAIPFLIIFGLIYWYLINSTWGVYALMSNYVLFSFTVILAIIGFFTLIVAFMYSYVLLTKLNLEYLEWKKLALWKNYYFNFKLFWVYFKTMFLNILILITPFIIAGVLMIFLILIFGWISSVQGITSNWPENIFSILSLIIFIISIIWFIYLMYKTSFTFIVLVDESKWEKFKKSIYYIKKSFALTKWFKTFFRFVIIWFLVLVITLPLTIPLNYFSANNIRLWDYLEYKVHPEEFDLQDSKTFYYLESLKWEFDSKNINDLSNTLNKNIKIKMFLEVLNFLLIYGLFEMMFASFYKRELLWETKKDKKQNKDIENKIIEKSKIIKEKKKILKKEKIKKIENKTKKITKKEDKPEVKKIGRPKKTEKQEIPKKRGRPRKTDK